MDERAKRLSRRHFLGSAAAVAGGAILAACGGSSSATDTAKPAVSSAAGGATTAPTTAAATTASATTASATTASAATQPATTGTTATTAAPAASSAAGSPAATGTTSGGKTIASQIDPAAIKKGGHITEADTTDIRVLNPIVGTDVYSGYITSLIFDGLVIVDPDTLDASPRLATKWEIAPDGKTYTFTLKQGVKWHDGQPFSADDVKFSYDLYMDPKTGTPRAGTLNEHIASVTVKDPQTVVFTLKDVIAPFMVTDVGYGIVPKHVLENVKHEDIPTSEFTTAKPIGTGPFKFKEWVRGDHVTVVANPDYHLGAPALDQYVYKVVKDKTVLYQQLKTGEIDYGLVSPDFFEDAKKQTNFDTVPYDTFGFTYIGFNLDMAKTTLFQDAKVRQALSYALDRKSIVEKILNNLGTVGVGTEPFRSWAYAPDKITTKYDYDPKKAAQMLDDAGWKKGSDGIRAKDGKKLSFTLSASSGDKVTEGTVSVFQENWKDIGVEMKPQLEEFSNLVTRVAKNFDFDVFLLGFVQGVDADQQTFFDSKQHGSGFNRVAYKNLDVDKLLDQALHTLDREKRKQLYIDAQNLIVADVPILVTYFSKNIYGINKRIKNRIPNAVTTFNVSHLWYVTDGK
ncbi:MAG: peptide-binding protein [Chloroflexota bacterium]|nr:peptide-binding protein [Chloroflexota bacterium]